MSIDLSKLTPAPWIAESIYEPAVESGGYGVAYRGENGALIDFEIEVDQADADFIALARNAFDVMMRRGWHMERFSLLGGAYAWRVPQDVTSEQIRLCGASAVDFCRWCHLVHWPDPFTALVEADKWYAANVEANRE